ncbi:FadR/GntR family transcriptional regulator [Paenibacillus sp. GCM10027628]|uniref:FadR/GntR family transcriptional regulator n=1 Tax=Paenibacillus sp. GCM10027628 TaxID=3273413 RepID=UPI00363F0A07
MRKIKKLQLHEIAAQEIIEYIRKSGLQKGDKLPPIEEIVQLLGVSRTSIREALRSLEAMDFVKIQNGKGIYVDDPSSYRFSMKIDVEDEKTFMIQACQVRRALEGLAVELATEHASDEQIQSMMLYLDEIRSNYEVIEITTAADRNFHKTIYEASGNLVLQSIILSLSTFFEKFWVRAPLGQERLFEDTFPFHPIIAQAIADRDKDKAMSTFHQLMDAIEAAILNVPMQ